MQTSYSNAPARAREGLVADSRTFKHIVGRIAQGTLKAGVGCFRQPTVGAPGSNMADPGQVYQNPSPVVAVDADAIFTSFASSASISTKLAASATGVVGSGTMTPARKLTLTLSNHTDWDATTAVIRYYDQGGVLQSENLSIPNGGNTTLTTTGHASSFVDLTIPAQTGAGGTAEIGIAVLDSGITIADYIGVVVFTPMVVAASTATATAAEFADRSVVDVMQKGAIWVDPEGTPAVGDDVFVRIGSGAGGTQLGAFRNDADTATAVQIVGAKFGRSEAGLTVVELF